MKISLRMNLSDFINKDYEKDIIEKLEGIHNDDIKYYLTLWYKRWIVWTQDIKRVFIRLRSLSYILKQR